MKVHAKQTEETGGVQAHLSRGRQWWTGPTTSITHAGTMTPLTKQQQENIKDKTTKYKQIFDCTNWHATQNSPQETRCHHHSRAILRPLSQYTCKPALVHCLSKRAFLGARENEVNNINEQKYGSWCLDPNWAQFLRHHSSPNTNKKRISTSSIYVQWQCKLRQHAVIASA